MTVEERFEKIYQIREEYAKLPDEERVTIKVAATAGKIVAELINICEIQQQRIEQQDKDIEGLWKRIDEMGGY